MLRRCSHEGGLGEGTTKRFRLGTAAAGLGMPAAGLQPGEPRAGRPLPQGSSAPRSSPTRLRQGFNDQKSPKRRPHGTLLAERGRPGTAARRGAQAAISPQLPPQRRGAPRGRCGADGRAQSSPAPRPGRFPAPHGRGAGGCRDGRTGSRGLENGEQRTGEWGPGDRGGGSGRRCDGGQPAQLGREGSRGFWEL